jgi:hypothetical protein
MAQGVGFSMEGRGQSCSGGETVTLVPVEKGDSVKKLKARESTVAPP